MGEWGTRKHKGIPIPVTPPTTGNVFYVDSGSANGSDTSAAGKNPNVPFSSWDFAVGQCTANNGDQIILMPGHVEDFGDTSAGGFIDLDVAGVTTIGIGSGSDQPRIDFNHADTDFIVGANDNIIENVHFSATVTGVKLGVAIETLNTGTIIRNCRFSVETTATDEFLIAINLTVGCNWTTVDNCHIDMGLGGAATGIKLVGASTDIFITNNMIKGDYSLACIAGLTTLSTEVYIGDNILVNGGSANVGAVAVISMVAASTGMVRGNTFFCNVATGVLQIVSTGMFFSDNWHGEDPGSANTAGQSRGTGLDIASINPFADD